MMKKYIPFAISAILLVIILLAIPGKDSFLLDASDIIDKIDTNDFIISADQLSTLMETEDIVLVDMNPPGDFMDSSLPGAINIPMESLNINSIREAFKESGSYIIYSKETASSCNAWMLLTQMGYENILVFKTN